MSWHDSQLVFMPADSSRRSPLNKSDMVDCKDGLSLCIIVRKTIRQRKHCYLPYKGWNRRKKCKLASAWVVLRYANQSQWNNATWSQRQRSVFVRSRVGLERSFNDIPIWV